MDRVDRFDLEFCGFFLGEGCIDVTCDQRYGLHYPRLRIGMAEHERGVLDAIKARYGGSIYVGRSGANGKYRQASWQLQGKAALGRVCAILEGAVLPVNKRREVELLREALDLITERGSRAAAGNQERLAAIKQELQDTKQRGKLL